MSCVHLATALVLREGHVLLVASRYPNHTEPLWNLPGGRQQPGELLQQTVAREVREETGLDARVGGLCYVSESYDGDMHFMNFTFAAEAQGEHAVPRDQSDHVVDVRWTPIGDLENQIAVRVVREPLLAYLRGDLPRYAGYAEAGISIVFPD